MAWISLLLTWHLLLLCFQASSGPTSSAEQLVHNAARLAQEAHAWGFDLSLWRAHLNAATWPEIFRQVAVAAGAGPARPRPRAPRRLRDSAMGTEGEDLEIQGAEGGTGLRLRVPTRFAPGSMKAAVWQVRAGAILGPRTWVGKMRHQLVVYKTVCGTSCASLR